MAKTLIKFLRGAGMPTGRAFVVGNAGTLSSCEPWVNTTAKQMWVDNVCINPHLEIASGDSSYLTLAYSQDSTSKEVVHTLTLDEAALASYVLGTGHDFLVKYMSSGENPTELSDTVYDINGNTDGFIKIGSGLAYDPDTNTISAPVIESFLSGVEVVNAADVPAAQNPVTGHKYMHFTFTTQGSPAATEIYVDITEFYDDTDTKTQISGTANDDVVVTLTSNNGTFTNNTTNTYTVVHKTITTTPDTDTDTVSNGGTFDAITDVTVSNGHVTGYTTTTFTIPTGVKYDFDADVPTGGASFNLNLKGDDNSTDTVNIKHAAQDNNGVGSKISFSASQNEITMQIDEIDGGTF